MSKIDIDAKSGQTLHHKAARFAQTIWRL